MSRPIRIRPATRAILFQAFQSLMPYRVQDILLVSSLYDSFTLQEDGRLNELIVGEFLELSLHQTPGLTHVASGRRGAGAGAAPSAASTSSSRPLPRRHGRRRARARGQAPPGSTCRWSLLAYDNNERKEFAAHARRSRTSTRVFLWQGNARILVAIVKLARGRAQRRARHALRWACRVILVVEDNVRYYSAFLPGDLHRADPASPQRLISEGVNLSHKLVRMRARPKILLATTLRGGLGPVRALPPVPARADLRRRVPAAARRDARGRLRAGAPRARDARPTCRSCSSRAASSFAARRARSAPRSCASTRTRCSPTCAVHGRVLRLRRLRVPAARRHRGRSRAAISSRSRRSSAPCRPRAIAFHGERNHFSNWFTARTEFALARKLQPRKVSDFPTLEHLRHDLIESIAEYRREQSEIAGRRLRSAHLRSRRRASSLVSAADRSAARPAASPSCATCSTTTTSGARFPGVQIAVPLGGRARHRLLRSLPRRERPARPRAREPRRRRDRAGASPRPPAARRGAAR